MRLRPASGHQHLEHQHPRIAAATKRPGRVIGMHSGPVPIMKLVEIINGYSTKEEVTKAVVDLSDRWVRSLWPAMTTPVVANRILMPMINEAICSLHEGVGGVEEIDTIMKLGMAHPMGPLQLADFIGLDVPEHSPRPERRLWQPEYAPSALLVNMVAAGKMGVKSGEGFYDYSEGPKAAKVSTQFA